MRFTKADYPNWRLRPLWTMEEGLQLLADIEPVDNFLSNFRHYRSSHNLSTPLVSKLKTRFDIAERAIQAGEPAPDYDHHLIPRATKYHPGKFLHWAKMKGFSIPKELDSLLILEDREYISPTDTLEKIRSTEYWRSLECKAVEAIKLYPDWCKKQKEIRMTGNLEEWIESITDNTRETEIIKKVLTEVFNIKR